MPMRDEPKPIPLPRVVLKFKDDVDLPYVDDAAHAVGATSVAPWDRLRNRFPGVRVLRLYRSVTSDGLKQLMERAADADPAYKPRNLLTYFVVECPPDVEASAVAKELSSWPSVERAYVDAVPAEPNNPIPVCDLSYQQAPSAVPTGGINAQAVWPLPGGTGGGQRVIDLEHQWNANHRALTYRPGIMPPLFGETDANPAHGTSVLGILCGRDAAAPGVGVFSGIVPDLQSVHVVSSKRVSTSANPTTAALSTIPDAIVAALGALQFGDVLLIEEQTDQFWPCEADLACFDAIRLATALGIVVIEAAGNRGSSLDTYADSLGVPVLFRDPANAQFKDSVAIMVAAASSLSSGAAPYSHAWQIDSNFGQRIDCYAWDDGVYTCTSANPGDTTPYTCFSGTSAAAAIIAGAALSTQGMMEASQGRRLSPAQMRHVLADPAYGTPGTGNAIGVMPDLAKIAQFELNVMPDVYLRDYVGDVGGTTSAFVASSPDIILRTARETTPQTAFGAGSGVENDYSISQDAIAGRDHFVYVRLLNRGGTGVSNVTVTVYWSEPATLITPGMWTLVGSATVPAVPVGQQLMVSNEIPWSAASIPASGHYCFVATADHPSDPAPSPVTVPSWDDFVRWVTANNNVGWRNFNVVSPVPLSGSSAIRLPFFIKGDPQRARAMHLEVVARLPFGSQVGIQLPRALVHAWRLSSPYMLPVRGTPDVVVPMNPAGAYRFPVSEFPAGFRQAATLHVSTPPGTRGASHDVYARQVFEGREVGRVTWRLARVRQRPPATPVGLHIIPG